MNKKTYRKLNLLGKGGTSRVYMVTGERNELFALKRVGLENADDQTVQGCVASASARTQLTPAGT